MRLGSTSVERPNYVAETDVVEATRAHPGGVNSNARATRTITSGASPTTMPPAPTAAPALVVTIAALSTVMSVAVVLTTSCTGATPTCQDPIPTLPPPRPTGFSRSASDSTRHKEIDGKTFLWSLVVVTPRYLVGYETDPPGGARSAHPGRLPRVVDMLRSWPGARCADSLLVREAENGVALRRRRPHVRPLP